jgi:hypothetical protein
MQFCCPGCLHPEGLYSKDCFGNCSSSSCLCAVTTSSGIPLFSQIIVQAHFLCSLYFVNDVALQYIVSVLETSFVLL